MSEARLLPDYPWVARRPITVAEYHHMGEVGIPHEDDRIELIEGEIVAMAPIGSAHSGRINRLTRLLVTIVGAGGVVAVQNPIRLSNITEPRPDFAVLKPRADDYTSETPHPADVLLVVEVADSSLDYDSQVKHRLYARAGIPAYWVVDVQRGVVQLCRDPAGDTYRDVGEYGPGHHLPVPSTRNAVIAVASIFQWALRDATRFRPGRCPCG